MFRRRLYIQLLLLLALTSAAPAQREPTKFDGRGNLIWITDLLLDTVGCEPSRIFSGPITMMQPFRGDNADSFEFYVKPASGKPVKLMATIFHDEGAVLVDLENMLQPRVRLKVKARQCGSGGVRTVEEMWRL